MRGRGGHGLRGRHGWDRGVDEHGVERGLRIQIRLGPGGAVGGSGGHAVLGFGVAAGAVRIFGSFCVVATGSLAAGTLASLVIVIGRLGVGGAVGLRLVGALGTLGPRLPRRRRALGCGSCAVKQLGERGGRLPGFGLGMAAGAGRMGPGRQDGV